MATLLEQYRSNIRKLMKEDTEDQRRASEKSKKSSQVDVRDRTVMKPFDMDMDDHEISEPTPASGRQLSAADAHRRVSSMAMPAGAHAVAAKLSQNLANHFVDHDEWALADDDDVASTTAEPEPQPEIPDNLPANIRRDVFTKKGGQTTIDIDWIQVRDLPGYAQTQIRKAFAPLFRTIMSNKLEDVNVATDLGGLNGHVAMKQLIGRIIATCTPDDDFSLEAFDIDPAQYHINKALVYVGEQHTYLILEEHLQGNKSFYVYCGNSHRGTKIGAGQAQRGIGNK